LLNYSYYPFDNKLENLKGNDLALLRQIAEGWYIDYKVQGLKIPEFAKHLSAFANQFGGWLIIGVSENNDGSRTASEFPGIDKSDVEKISRDIREASAAHINPEVLYEEKVIEGPINEIGLNKGKSIIIIGIPMSLNTPHIHSSGRIYRRLADQSKPKEEVDRYILDDLWKRGNNHRNKKTEFLTKIPRLPDSQSDSPWVHIFFSPSESQLSPSVKLKFDEFSQIVTNSDQSILGVHAPMQAINTTSDGFIARQIKGNDPSLASLSIRWWHDGSVRLDIPLNAYDFSSFLDTHEKNKYAKQYCDLACDAGYKQIKIVDYSIFVQAAASLTNCYIHMLNATNDKRDVYSCFSLRNVFHTSPYVDSESFMNRINKFSLPLTMDQDIRVPKEPSEENMFFHDSKKRDIDYSNNKEYLALPFLYCWPVVFRLFESTGIITDLDTFAKDIESWGFNKINNASTNP